MNDINNNNTGEKEEVPVYKDRSLMYMAIGLGVIILIMGYLTLFVDDPWKIFSHDKKPEKVIDDGSKGILDKNASMSDEEIRSSLVKFIEAFYFDEKRGYFDPPSYFAPITDTFYNYHNLNYQRLKDIYWKRMSGMQNFSRSWIVSSLDFSRSDSGITATYWARESYIRSLGEKYAADIQYEMVINNDGKITSLRDIDVRNEQVTRIGPDSVPMVKQVSPEQTTNSETTPELKVYDMSVVESAPEFPGGQRELSKFINNTLKYPSTARQNNIQGKVYLGFIVEKDGSIGDIKIKQGIGGGCDEEAVRVIKSSPKWKPGTIKGQAVRTYCVLPIVFQPE